MKTEVDLENTPLEIRSNKQSETIAVNFYTAQGDTAGGISLKLWVNPPRYWLNQCSTTSGKKYIPTEIPSETDKVWKISLTGTSDERRVVVSCNSKEVLNVVLSDTCRSSSWNSYWSRGVGKIEFDSGDKASDFYRAG